VTTTLRTDADELARVVRDFLEKNVPEAEVRRLMATEDGADPRVWRQLAGLGLTGLVVPEAFDGAGASPVELGAVFEEMGAALFCGPFLATVGLAATALLECGTDEARAEHLPAIAEGTRTATLAWAGPSPDRTTLTAVPDGRGWRLSGTAPVVVDGATAELVLVAARTPEGPGLFALPDGAPGVRRHRLSPLDLTRKLAELRLDDAPAVAVGSTGADGPGLRRTADLAALYLAAEQLGGAARVLATAVAYAGTRIQFGRAIGSFQAIKHRCADLLVDVESARSVVHAGLEAAAHRPAELPLAASLARSVASDVFTRVASQNIQIHGGIGFTWEHSAHLYLKRAKSSQLLLGTPAAARARLAGMLGIVPGAAEVVAAAAESPDTPAEAADPDVLEFLRHHPVPDPRDPAHDADADRAFREARFDAGLARVDFAPGRGGRGWDSARQAAVDRTFREAGAADHGSRNVIGLGMALPTLYVHGTEEQKDRHLRPLFSGEHIWCQLFSEPGAGSDLAALATRAVRDGDEYVVNGQKVWTSLAHVARYGLLLARTDPDVPKHRGLTYFVLDMTSPGVEVKPLRQLTGHAEFNEVYLTDVRVPVENRLGEEGQGWAVAMTTLMSERVAIGGQLVPRGGGPIAQAVEQYRRAAEEGRADAATTERLMLLWTAAEAARLTNVRSAARGRTPGPEGSIAKLQMAELNQAIFEFCVDVAGTDGLLIDGYPDERTALSAAQGGGDYRRAYLRTRANSIEGGTSEVLRNILGERVLGLPGEPRVDRDVAWKDVRRS
jgi:alkylation response protein AidB-like acyl-CoA dehydrogenase